MSAPVIGVNHAVLWVTDPRRSAAFYAAALGLEIEFESEAAVFMSSPLSDNDHDLGLLRASRDERARERRVGLYHLAFEIPTLADLADARDRLAELGALVGQSDHGISKSLYAHDPDGNEFEVMWQVPLDLAPDDSVEAPATGPLDLDAEIARYGARTPTRTLALIAGSAAAGHSRPDDATDPEEIS